jgi:hypothetical protein
MEYKEFERMFFEHLSTGDIDLSGTKATLRDVYDTANIRDLSSEESRIFLKAFDAGYDLGALHERVPVPNRFL